jgi:CheY-like chemotaxis protein
MPEMISRPDTTELDASTVDVLVVDDDHAFRTSLLESIQRLGFVALAAHHGAEALRLARDRPPRLILLDLQMPVVNGWQFLERRRSDRQLARIPVVVVSGIGVDVSARDDLAGQLAKPVDEGELLAVLEEFLSCPPAALPDPLETGAAAGLILVVEDDEDTQDSVVELLRDDGYRVARANNGQEAEAFLHRGERPDCIVLDLWMPVMNGWSFTARLRQLGGTPIPIVVITAAEPYWGYPVPLTQVMRKPLHADRFLALMRTLVEQARPAASGERQDAPTTARSYRDPRR